MKTFNVTAQAYDSCSSTPYQILLLNELVKADSSEEAEKKFCLQLLIDDMIVTKILSSEEIAQDAA